MSEQKTTLEQEILRYCNAYPQCEIQDIFKLLQQSILGNRHFLTAESTALQHILQEAPAAAQDTLPKMELLIGGKYCRVHLSVLSDGLSPATLCRLFFLSAQSTAEETANQQAELQTALTTVAGLLQQQKLPFASVPGNAALQRWQAEGCPACHHSTAFRAAYRPAYRVIKSDYVRLLPLLTAIDAGLRQKASTSPSAPFILALEGRCASGKTTLAQMLQQIYGCNVLHMDDFFLRPEQRTEKRLQAPGENIDHERFLTQVLQPLVQGQAPQYQRYDCHRGELLAPVVLPRTLLTVVEGVYCLHPSLVSHYDLKVFLEIGPEKQRQRILHRNTPTMAEKFFTQWIPLEESYFAQCRVQQLADLTLPEAVTDL